MKKYISKVSSLVPVPNGTYALVAGKEVPEEIALIYSHVVDVIGDTEEVVEETPVETVTEEPIVEKTVTEGVETVIEEPIVEKTVTEETVVETVVEEKAKKASLIKNLLGNKK